MKTLHLFLILLLFVTAAFAQSKPKSPNEVIAGAVEALGGEAYLKAKTFSSKGQLSITQGARITSFQSFVDIIVYPDKERTDFKERGARTVQVNTGETGWLWDETFETLGPQSPVQVANFKRSMRVHYDYLLRGRWKGKAEIKYVGRRQAGVGRRNDVLRLDFEDGFRVEYEISDKGIPEKSLYEYKTKDNVELKEELRFARFLDIDGIRFPHVVDNYRNGKRVYRINYEEVYFNRRVNPKIFVMPKEGKKIKKLKVK